MVGGRPPRFREGVFTVSRDPKLSKNGPKSLLKYLSRPKFAPSSSSSLKMRKQREMKKENKNIKVLSGIPSNQPPFSHEIPDAVALLGQPGRSTPALLFTTSVIRMISAQK